jgi:hypothetical protein
LNGDLRHHCSAAVITPLLNRCEDHTIQHCRSIIAVLLIFRTLPRWFCKRGKAPQVVAGALAIQMPICYTQEHDYSFAPIGAHHEMKALRGGAMSSRYFRNYVFLIIMCLVPFIFWGCNSGGGSTSVPTGSGGGEGAGALQGKVVDSDSIEGLDHAAVSIGNLSTITDSEGNYSFSDITPGTQTVRVAKKYYDSATASIDVVAGAVTTRDIQMDSSADDWLEQGTAYRWQVEAVHDDGSVVPGPVWSFTTESEGQDRLRPAVVAKGIDSESARTVAVTFLKEQRHGDRSIAKVESINDAVGSALAYLFMLDPTGYIIVPASRADRLPPVLAYSFDSACAYSRDTPPMLISMVRTDIQMRLAAYNDGKTLPVNKRQRDESLWDRYLAGNARTELEKKVYGPFLYYPAWHQRSPYNDLCPEIDVLDENGNPTYDESGNRIRKRCLVGCPATALGMIFNAWWCPTSATLTGSYITRTRKIEINKSDANFSSLEYNRGNPGDTEKAKLCRFLGYLANMNYNTGLSTANTLTLGKAISGKFGYGTTSDIEFDTGRPFDPSYMKANLTDYSSTQARPVVLTIAHYDSAGGRHNGHAIVCDGYNDAYDTYHLNFGWGKGQNEGSNGWYALPRDLPTSTDWDQKYNYIDGYIYNIYATSGRGKISSQQPSQKSRELAAAPENPFPRDGYSGAQTDDVLDWDDCADAVSYHCYVWKASEQKPSVPTFKNLPYAVADPNFLAP